MAKKLSSPTDKYVGVIRPVVLDIAKQVVKALGMTEPNLKIMFPGQIETLPLYDSTLGLKSSNDMTYFTNVGALEIKYSENYQSEYFTESNRQFNNHNYLFADPVLGVMMRPIYANVEGNLSFTYRARDHETAVAWLDRYRQDISANIGAIPHEVQYRYPFPPDLMMDIVRMWELRENVAGYNETFPEYFHRRVSEKFTHVTQLDGTDPTPYFVESQSNILGSYDLTTVPEKDRGDNGTTYNITFDYKFTYDRITDIELEYPLVVHNQFVAEDLLPLNQGYRYIYQKGELSRSNLQNEFFRQRRTNWDEVYDGIKIPYFDDWSPGPIVMSTMNLATVLLLVEENTTELMNLGDIPDYELDVDVVEFLKTNHELLTGYFNFPFCVSLYKDNYYLDDVNVMVDGDLNITTDLELDLRSVYHVRFSLVSDLTLLEDRAHDLIRNNPKVCHLILSALDPALVGRIGLPSIINNRLVNKTEYFNFIKKMKYTDLRFTSPFNFNIPTVGSFYVRVSKLENK